jgi:hypothetical protein
MEDHVNIFLKKRFLHTTYTMARTIESIEEERNRKPTPSDIVYFYKSLILTEVELEQLNRYKESSLSGTSIHNILDK